MAGVNKVNSRRRRQRGPERGQSLSSQQRAGASCRGSREGSYTNEPGRARVSPSSLRAHGASRPLERERRNANRWAPVIPLRPSHNHCGNQCRGLIVRAYSPLVRATGRSTSGDYSPKEEGPATATNSQSESPAKSRGFH